MRKLIALAAAAALFALPALAAPVYVPGQGGTVGPNVACTNSDGVTVRCIQPSVTLNDATGAAIGTAGNPLITTPGAGSTSTIKIDQTTPGTTNGVVVNSSALPSGAATSAAQTAVQAPVTPATATATSSTLLGCQNLSALPTFTNAQQGALQCGTRGALHTEIFNGNSTNSAAVGIPTDSQSLSDGLYTTTRLEMFNGATMDRGFTCANSAAVSVTAGSTTQIVGLSGSTVIRVCSITLSMSAAGTAGVYTGTGTNCGTGTTALIQDMTLATGTPLAQVAPAGGSLVRSSAGGEICVKAVTGNVTGSISYVQY